MSAKKSKPKSKPYPTPEQVFRDYILLQKQPVVRAAWVFWMLDVIESAHKTKCDVRGEFMKHWAKEEPGMVPTLKDVPQSNN